MTHYRELDVRTRARQQMIDVTRSVSEVLRDSGIENGICLVYCPHTTAGVAVNENADPAVVDDTLKKLGELVPRTGAYKHVEGNSDAHIKSNLVGTSRTIPVREGRLVLGTWQSVFFCEFDGPRQRRLVVQVVGD